MKFYVNTVLEQKDDIDVTGDVYYVQDNVVVIAGVEHKLIFGDVVQHGNFSYRIEESEGCSVTNVWYLDDGRVPDDGEQYLLMINEQSNYSSELDVYLGLHNHVVSRSNRSLNDHGTYDKVFVTETKQLFESFEDGWIDRTNASRDTFSEAVKKHKEELRQQLVQEIFEGLEKPKDGPSGPRGYPGKPGKDGKDGPKGERGDKGEPGNDAEPGKDGKDGDDGKDGVDGNRGPKGDRGLKGDQGKPGKDGKDGKTGKAGRDGKRGPKGERGPPGKAGKVLTEQKIDDSLRREFEAYKDINEKYKVRLNVQLASLGGGGSAWLMDNQDVQFAEANAISNGDVLMWNANTQLFELQQVSTSSESDIPIFIQDDTPTTTASKYLWIQTGLGDDANSFTLWVETGD